MVSTHLKHISQIGPFPQVGVKMKKYLKPPPSIILVVFYRDPLNIMVDYGNRLPTIDFQGRTVSFREGKFLLP